MLNLNMISSRGYQKGVGTIPPANRRSRSRQIRYGVRGQKERFRGTEHTPHANAFLPRSFHLLPNRTRSSVDSRKLLLP